MWPLLHHRQLQCTVTPPVGTSRVKACLTLGDCARAALRLHIVGKSARTKMVVSLIVLRCALTLFSAPCIAHATTHSPRVSHVSGVDSCRGVAADMALFRITSLLFVVLLCGVVVAHAEQSTAHASFVSWLGTYDTHLSRSLAEAALPTSGSVEEVAALPQSIVDAALAGMADDATASMPGEADGGSAPQMPPRARHAAAVMAASVQGAALARRRLVELAKLVASGETKQLDTARRMVQDVRRRLKQLHRSAWRSPASTPTVHRHLASAVLPSAVAAWMEVPLAATGRVHVLDSTSMPDDVEATDAELIPKPANNHHHMEWMAEIEHVAPGSTASLAGRFVAVEAQGSYVQADVTTTPQPLLGVLLPRQLVEEASSVAPSGDQAWWAGSTASQQRDHHDSVLLLSRRAFECESAAPAAVQEDSATVADGTAPSPENTENPDGVPVLHPPQRLDSPVLHPPQRLDSPVLHPPQRLDSPLGQLECVVGHEVLHFDSEDAVVEYIEATPDSGNTRRRLAASAHEGGFFQDDFVVGTRTAMVIFGEFSDRPLGLNASDAVAFMQDRMADIMERTAHWSRGTFGLSLDLIIPHLYNLGTYPGSSTTSGSWMSNKLQEAVAAEPGAGYTWDNVTKFQHRIMVFPCLGTSWAGLGSVKGSWSWYSCKPGLTVLMHELGHNFGFTHARFNTKEYGSQMDVMGGGSFVKNDVFSGVQLYGAQWQDPARVTFLQDNWPSATTQKGHCVSTPGAVCSMDATVRLAPVDAHETANMSLPTDSWGWGIGYQLPSVDYQAWMWAEFRANSTKVEPGITVNVAPRVKSNGIGYTELQDAHPYDTSQANTNVVVGSAYVFMGTRQGDDTVVNYRGEAYLTNGNQPVLMQATRLHPAVSPTSPPLLTTGVSLLRDDGTRVVGKGCDGAGWCEPSFLEHISGRADTASLLTSGSTSFSGTFTSTKSVFVYAINTTAPSTVVLEATTCTGTDGHLPTRVAVYSGTYPPIATAMYGGDMLSGAAVASSRHSCSMAPQDALSLRLSPSSSQLAPDAMERLMFVVVGVDRNLPPANRSGTFRLSLNVVTTSVPCQGRIYVDSGNFWNGGWSQDQDVPVFNGHPHFTKDSDSAGKYHLVWNSRNTAWCILTKPDNWAASYGCAPSGTGADSIFNMSWWSGSSVRVACHRIACVVRSECRKCACPNEVISYG